MKTQHFDFVDAIRGYAVLAVIIVHVASAFQPTMGEGMRLFEQGARGVQLFYVASALTLLMSWHSREDGYIPFIIRRIFRILPLFWLATPIYLLFAGAESGYFAPPADWSVSDLMRQLFFLDSIFPGRNSIAPGGWTVNTEVLFYILFPILVYLIRTWQVAVAAYFLSLVVIVQLYPKFFSFVLRLSPELPESTTAVWTALSLPVQLPVFLAGFVTFFLLRDPKFLPSQNKKALLGLFIFAVSIAILYSFSQPRTIGFWGIPLGVLVFCLGRGVIGGLVNKPIVMLGKVSFSAYIWHFMVLNFMYLARDNGVYFFVTDGAPSYLNFVLCLIIVIVVTVLISCVTYKCIERPFVKIGNRCAERYISFRSCLLYARNQT